MSGTICRKKFGKLSLSQFSANCLSANCLVSGTSISKAIQGSSEDLRYQISSKDLWKIFKINDHSRTFGRCWISKIIQGSFCDRLPQNTRCYFRKAIFMSFGHRCLLVSLMSQKSPPFELFDILQLNVC